MQKNLFPQLGRLFPDQKFLAVGRKSFSGSNLRNSLRQNSWGQNQRILERVLRHQLIPDQILHWLHLKAQFLPLTLLLLRLWHSCWFPGHRGRFLSSFPSLYPSLCLQINRFSGFFCRKRLRTVYRNRLASLPDKLGFQVLFRFHLRDQKYPLPHGPFYW